MVPSGLVGRPSHQVVPRRSISGPPDHSFEAVSRGFPGDSKYAMARLRTRQNGRVKTTQLRRYTLVDGEYDAFVEWWRGAMPAVRPPAGFTIEFAYGLRESNEFVWAVSTPGDREEFARFEAAYLASDARAEVFAGVPQRVAVYDIRFVDDEPTAG